MTNDITIPAAIVGALIGAWALLYVWKLNARRAASTKFRSTILKAFSGLYPLPTDWPDEYSTEDIDKRLRAVFSDLQVAVAEFRPFLPWYRRWFFDQTWSRYRNAYSGKIEIDHQCYHHYIPFGDNPAPKGQFRRNVDALLSFAKYH